MASEKIRKLAAAIAALKGIEAKQINEELKDTYGIEQIQPEVQVINEVKETVVEQTEFDVILKIAGSTKLKVVKKIKELTSLGLRDAKELVDSAPILVKEKISQSEAEILKAELESVGAEVEIK